jgi:uncharacterized coiled-coil protein SlyX
MNHPPLGAAANVPPAATPTLEDLMLLLQESQARFQQLETRIQQQDVVIGQQDVRLQQQQVEMNQTKVELNQAQVELLNLQNVNAVPAAAAIPVVQPLQELPAGTVLRNRREAVVVVPDALFIRAYAGSLTETEKANLKPPVVKMEDVNTMTPRDWMEFARLLVHYYNVGGEKPITAILEELQSYKVLDLDIISMADDYEEFECNSNLIYLENQKQYEFYRVRLFSDLFLRLESTVNVSKYRNKAKNFFPICF